MRDWILFGVLVVLGCGNEVSQKPHNDEQTSGESRDPLMGGDPDLEKVREWLRQNLDSGQWEEVRWWPARPLKKQRANYISALESREEPALKRASTEDIEEALKKARSEPIKIAARLKYRSANRHGALELHDEVFYIYENSAERFNADSRITAQLLEDGDFPN